MKKIGKLRAIYFKHHVWDVKNPLHLKDIPNLKINDTNAVGTPLRESAMLQDYQTVLEERVKGIDIHQGGILDFEVFLSSNSSMLLEYIPIMDAMAIHPSCGPMKGGAYIEFYCSQLSDSFGHSSFGCGSFSKIKSSPIMQTSTIFGETNYIVQFGWWCGKVEPE